jgi:hypothetical protein
MMSPRALLLAVLAFLGCVGGYWLANYTRMHAAPTTAEQRSESR